MKLQKINSAFTLIELLVVITIIGILATGAVSIFTSQIQKARDSTRITAMNAMKSSIEQFYQDTSEYPLGGAAWLSGAGTDVQDYLPQLPSDPKDGQSCSGPTTCGYAYMVADDSNGIENGAFELSTGFENSGNVENKANNDGGNDSVRFEIIVGDFTLDTSKTTAWGATVLTTADTTNDKIHVGAGTGSGSIVTTF